jgi:hypothetical protein
MAPSFDRHETTDRILLAKRSILQIDEVSQEPQSIHRDS